MGFLREFITITAECVLATFKSTEQTEQVVLEETHDGRTGYEIVRKRVLHRFKDKANNLDSNTPKYTFEEIFDLPPWLSFDAWLYIQLRGRCVDDLFILNIDHIVPLSLANTVDELKILVSWRNTRLLDPDINTAKASYIDNENRLLCEALLNRAPQSNWDGHLGRVVPPANKVQSSNIDERFKKLISNKGRKKKK